MKKLVVLLVVLLAFSINAICCNLSSFDGKFKISKTSKCKCNPLENGTCIDSVVTFIPAYSDSAYCPGLCSMWTVCLLKYGQNSPYPGYTWTFNSPVNDSVTFNKSTLMPLPLGYTDTMCCFRVIRTIITCGSNPPVIQLYGDTLTFCIEPNPKIDLPHSICAGTGTEICNGSNNNYQYEWIGCGMNSGWSSNPCFITPATSCTFTVEVKDTNKCYSTWSITVISSDTVGVSITDNWHNPCSLPDTIKFTAHPVNGGSTPLYQWKFYGHNSGSPTTKNTYKLPNPKNGDSVSCDMTSSLPQTSCQSNNPATSNTITVIGTTPVISVSPVSSPVCAGDTAKYVINVSSGTPPYSYVWIKNGITEQVSNNDTVSFPVAMVDSGTYFYYGVSDVNGCNPTYKSYMIIVNSSPAVSSILPASKAVCLGSPAEFTVIGTGEGLSYQWYKQESPDHLISWATNSSYTIIPNITSDAGHYFCVITNAPAGCEVTSNKVILTVLPKPAVSISPPSPVLCTTSSVPLTARGASTYTWLYATSLGSITDSTVIASPAVTTTYTVIGTNLSGCKDTAKVTVTYSRPEVSITSNPDNPICSGNSLTLTASGTPSNSYTWSPSNGLNTTTGSTVTASPTVTTTYTVTGTDEHYCTNTAKVTVFVNTPVIVDATNLIIVKNNGDTVSFHINPGGHGPFSFKWLRNDTVLTNTNDSIYTINSINCNDNGLYTCRVINACDSVIAKKIRLYVNNCYRYLHAISGYVKYDNADSNALCKSTTVYLRNSGDTILASIATDTNGYYAFVNLINGAYKLTCKTTIPWGGVNPVDALLIDRTYVHLSKITDPLRRLAADLNNDGKINVIDALLIDRRYIHLTNKFTIPDWLFSNPSVTMNNVDITNENIMAICAGDVNGSYSISPHGLPDCKSNTTNTIVPNSKIHNYTPQMLANLCKISIDSVVSNPGDTVDIPVRVKNFSPVAALGLQISYSPTNLKFLKIKNLNPVIPDSLLSYYASPHDSIISIVWLQSVTDTNCLRLANAKLFDLQFVYKSGTDTLSFTPDCIVGDDSLNTLNVIYQSGNIGPLYITTQPQNATKCLGDSVSFSIAAAGTDSINYRWLKLVAGSWTLEPGDTNSVFKISQVALSDSGKYKFVASNKYGRLSDSVTLTVNTPVAITYSSPDTTTCSVPVTLNCFATGTGLSYQWYNSESAVGYGNDTLITSVADNYYCIVSGACAGTTSSYTTLTVNTPPSILTQPQNDTVCSGANASFSLLASGTSLTYQWYDMNWNIVGEDSTLAINNVELNNSNNNYQCYVSNYCSNVWTDAAYIFVDTLPSISQQPEFNSICTGSEQDFYIYASSNGFYTLYYQWYRNDTLYPDSINPTFNVLNSKLSDEGVYFCTVSNTCGSVSSDTASLFTDSQIQIINQPSGATIESGESFSFSIAVKGNGLLSFQWYQDGSMTGYNDSVYYISSASVSDTGKYVCEVTDACWDVFSDTVELAVVGYNPCDNHFRRYLNPNSRPVCPRFIHNNPTINDPEVNLYPNPNDGSFTLELKLPSDGNVTLEAYNVLGRLVQSSNFKVQSPLFTIRYSLYTLKGIYFLNIITSTKTFNRKVIIE